MKITTPIAWLALLAPLASLTTAQLAFPVLAPDTDIMPESWDDIYDLMDSDFQDRLHIAYTDGSIRGKRVDKYLPPGVGKQKRLASDESAARVYGGQLYLDLMLGWSKGHGIGGSNTRYKLPVNLWNNVSIVYDYDDLPNCFDALENPDCPIDSPCGKHQSYLHSCDYNKNGFAYNTTNGTLVNSQLGYPDGYHISLLDQTFVGDLYTDYVQMGDSSGGGPALPVQGFAFAASKPGSSMFAGMGFAPGHHLLGSVGDTNVSTDFSEALMISGYTESRSLALYLVNGSTTSPHMMFGGLDTSLAKDNFFVSYPLLKGNNFSYPTQYMVTLTGVSVTSNEGNSASLGSLGGSCGNNSTGDCVAVGFDTTSYMSYLPRNVVVNMAVQLNAIYAADLQMWIQSCSYRNIGGYLNIELTSNVFSVPISQVLVPMKDTLGNTVNFSGGEQACYLALRPSETQGYNSLGLGFMQNYYMVFDPDDNYVSLGTLKSLDELEAEAFKNRYPDPVKPLKPGRLSKIANVTTVSEQADITYQYSTPTSLTGVITTTSDGIAFLQGPGGAPVPSSENSMVYLTMGSSVLSFQGVPMGSGPPIVTGTPSTGNARIDPTGATKLTSSNKPPQIQILGVPVSGSVTIFRQGAPTDVSQAAQHAPTGSENYGAPRSGANRQGLGLAAGMICVGVAIMAII